MILVVCLNPALDITHHVENVDWAGVNRPTAVYARPGALFRATRSPAAPT